MQHHISALYSPGLRQGQHNIVMLWPLPARILNACCTAALCLALSLPTLALAVSPEGTQITRHPLELRALVDPQGVLKELPAELQKASALKDYKEMALLNLAQSNACRVIADWTCQINSAVQAGIVAKASGLPELQVRSLIAESRGRMAIQDFALGERLLGEAERLLKLHPSPELLGDVFLAYSSLSNSLGKHALAADYAARGLKALSQYPALMIRIRLLRNQSRALAQLGQTAKAQAALEQALTLTEEIQDPKLSAELHLEDARIARLTGDIPAQLANGRRILELAKQLSNSQLTGLGHEVLGLAALNQADSETAKTELRIAYDSFRQLGLARDERRALRALMQTLLKANGPPAELNALTTRLIELETSLEAADRAQASDDFDARLKYAQQEFEVKQLEAESALAAQRNKNLEIQQRYTFLLAASSILLLLIMLGFQYFQRRFNKRLKLANTKIADSESRYRTLADYSRDLVVRMRLDGQLTYVSPSAKEMLGVDPAVITQARWELIHPEDREMLAAALRELGEKGGSSTITYRTQHNDGHYVWIEALARFIPNSESGGPGEIIYSGRDITTRVIAEQALSLSETRMREITNNIPAIISHMDRDERYLFSNTFSAQVFGVDISNIIGHTIREVRGDKLYVGLKPYIDAVLRGERVSFEGKNDINGQIYFYQSNFMPDRDAQGNVQGFYSLTFDITDLKLAEAELERLSRIDGMTGVANRRYFEERLNSALSRCHRQNEAISLLYLDIDYLKNINDENGHAIGDEVIKVFADRVLSCVRAEDLVARLGGDEFAVIVENAEPESGEVIARKLRMKMQQPVFVDGVKIQLSSSIGVAYCAQAPSAKELMHLADKALYAAKSAGRSNYQTVVGE
jgi:diguanylate cyclase (GGDEF)-like protein/PAS domain S-box-containing protein